MHKVILVLAATLLGANTLMSAEPVTTKSFRPEMRLQAKFSGGVQEWTLGIAGE